MAYNILKVLKLRLAFCYFAVCGFLQLVFHVFSEGRAIWFWVGCIAVALWVLFCWIYAYYDGKRLRAKKREMPAEVVKPQSGEQLPTPSAQPPYISPQTVQPPAQPVYAPPQPIGSSVQPDARQYAAPPDGTGYPRRYRVAGRENYFFLEYHDRYELYRSEREGDVYVRTDYKNGQSEGL